MEETNDTQVVETEAAQETVEAESTQKVEAKVEKPQRTPEEEVAYHERRANQLRKKHNLVKEEKPQQSNEPDYAKLGFLNSVQVTHPDDQKAVIDEANRLKLPLTDVLQMEHIKNKLVTNRNIRESQAGMPSGGNRSGQGVKDVDYWLAKGGLPEDQDLAEKVVDKRMAMEKGRKFSDEMFN